MGAGGPVRPDHGGAVVNDLVRTVEALLFLSPEPVAVDRLADACEVGEGEIVEALARMREHYAEGFRGVVLREVAGGFTLATDPVAEHAARRLLARPRTPPLTQAQAECLAIVAYLQPVSRPEVARIRGVASESAVGTLLERGLIEESGRSRFGAVMYRTTELFEKLFGLSGLDALPDPGRFDPSPEDEGDIRERLLRAGEQRAKNLAVTARLARRQLQPRAGEPGGRVLEDLRASRRSPASGRRPPCAPPARAGGARRSARGPRRPGARP